MEIEVYFWYNKIRVISKKPLIIHNIYDNIKEQTFDIIISNTVEEQKWAELKDLM